MRLTFISLLIFATISLYGNHRFEPYLIEKRILILSVHLDSEMMSLSNCENLQSFCSDYTYRQTIFGRLDQIHEYHDMLERDLQVATYGHSRNTISRILKHLDHLSRKFNQDEFTDFFKDQCTIQSRIEQYADRYKAGYASHSYGSKVYAQEVVMYRYLKKLTRKVKRIKKNVEHFYIRRKVWEF